MGIPVLCRNVRRYYHGFHIGEYVELRIQRVIGTIIGVLAGVLFCSLLGSNVWSLGISIFLTILVSYVCKQNEAAKMGVCFSDRHFEP